MGKGLLGGAGGEMVLKKVSRFRYMPCVFAEAGMEHSKDHGTTRTICEDFVKNHHHSTMNLKQCIKLKHLWML